jgi:hypothetical protein
LLEDWEEDAMADNKKPPKLPYKDLPNLSETYADGVDLITFNSRALTTVFTVNRYDEPKPSRIPTGVRVPAVRLVLDANAFIELYNQLSVIVEGLAQQGILKREETGSSVTLQ